MSGARSVCRPRGVSVMRGQRGRSGGICCPFLRRSFLRRSEHPGVCSPTRIMAFGRFGRFPAIPIPWGGRGVRVGSAASREPAESGRPHGGGGGGGSEGLV